ncbi:trypsin [Dictyocaulus viviparus]|uniref:Trypsin n=1 Tax=Dictyocaulus viviparus TaxID=29172 RepID=A0A0D8XJ99_DICVI|nr:trypsin [Dictyocaulus viviparus]
MLILLAIVPLVFTQKITKEENCKLKKHCGAHFLEPHERHQRSIGGKRAKQNEFPWIVGYFIEKHGLTIPPGKQALVGGCTGTQISKRHIVTAAHCVATYNLKQCKNQRNPKGLRKVPYTIDKASQFKIFVGSGDLKPTPDKPTMYSVKNITVHKDYNPCSVTEDVAIIEVTPDISHQHGSPICMLNPDEEEADDFIAVGFGSDPVSHPQGHDILYYLQYINLRGPEYKKHRIVLFDKKKSICGGDSGGPLTQIQDDERYVLLGVTTAADPPCTIKDPKTKRKSVFLDLYYFLQWICDITGVCPLEESESECLPSQI